MSLVKHISLTNVMIMCETFCATSVKTRLLLLQNKLVEKVVCFWFDVVLRSLAYYSICPQNRNRLSLFNGPGAAISHSPKLLL